MTRWWNGLFQPKPKGADALIELLAVSWWLAFGSGPDFLPNGGEPSKAEAQFTCAVRLDRPTGQPCHELVLL
ncbi:hypothetical protein AB0K02_09790 [Streptomyces sp. NPDC049597]|uniref:hypothetical protein n=1 Tax=Streptomyces sp. NPDC049597 TaxID=3155276 RepID=UPI00344987BD